MKPEEAIETIKIAIAEVVWNYPIDYTVAFEEAKTIMDNLIYLYTPHGNSLKAWHMGIKALEKADKYRWHDLRKNPDDLPEAIDGGDESEYVLVMIGTPEWNSWEQAYYHHGKRLWSTYDQNVFAWRYIEPFEEEEEK